MIHSITAALLDITFFMIVAFLVVAPIVVFFALMAMAVGLL